MSFAATKDQDRKEMTPSLEVCFRHRPLKLDRHQIRLFRLEARESSGMLVGKIDNFDFENCPPYKAVSYTWGSPNPTREISIEEQKFTVRKNLWQFLNTICDADEGWLWIDQICIDQSAVDEKNHQVNLMAKIYANAAETLIWLGIEADGSDDAMDAINAGFNETLHQKSHVEAIFGRQYWERLWVVQEILMGQKILILCGKKRVAWEKLEALCVPQDYRSGVPWKYPVRIHSFVLALIEEKVSFNGKGQRLSCMLETFAGSQCEDVRDKVFGLLSLVKDFEAPPVDYSKSPAEVFFVTLQRVVICEHFMELDSHWEVGRNLRDQMILMDISDSKILQFIRNVKSNHSFREDIINKNMEYNISHLLQPFMSDIEYVARVSRMPQEVVEKVARDTHGRTMLARAAAEGHITKVKTLLDHNSGLDSRDSFNQTPLSLAAENGHEAVVQVLLEKGAELEAQDCLYQTPLSLAAERGHWEVVKILLKQGADVMHKDKFEQTALSWAAQKGHLDVIKVMLENGIEVDLGGYNKRTMTSFAAERGHTATVKLLLERGADFNLASWFSRTPLSYAAENGHEAVVQLFLEKGAELTSKDSTWRRTPLSWAIQGKHAAVAKLLLDNGAELESKDIQAHSLLMSQDVSRVANSLQWLTGI